MDKGKTTGKGKPFDLRERTVDFGVRILEICERLPDSQPSRVVQAQLSASGTSIGANVEEADSAYTKADKRKSFVISRKEAAETRFWLRVVGRKWKESMNVVEDLQEADELINILSSIIDKLR